MLLILLAMLLTCVTWLAWGTIFIGLGGITARWFGARLTTPDEALNAFWVGLAVTFSVLQVWHLFLPIDERAVLVLATSGLIGFARVRHELAAIIKALNWRGTPVKIVGLLWLVFVVYLANRAIGYPLDGDSSLYHTTFIFWARSYPIVPGLANLVENYGFNNVGFLYSALLDNGLWQYHSNHFVNTLWLLFISLTLALAGIRWLRGNWQPENVILVLISGLVLMLTNSNSTASHSSDLMVAFWGIVTFSEFLRSLREAPTTPAAQYRLVVILGLCVTSLLLKLSFALFFFVIGVITLWRWLRHHPTAWRGRAFISISLWSALVLGAWVGRGIILSGYPFFPLPYGALDVDWRVPLERTLHSLDAIRWYGRSGTSMTVMEGWTWLPSWLAESWNDIYYGRIPLLMVLAAGLAGGALRVTGRWQMPRYALIGLLPLAGGLALWFWSSPQLRFASVLIWLTVAVCWTGVVLGWQTSDAQRRRLIVALWLVGLAYPLFLLPRTERILTTAGQDLGFYSVRDFDMQASPMTTHSGIVLYLSNNCYYQSLLCTPYPKVTLEYRVPDDMAQGFRLDEPRD